MMIMRYIPLLMLLILPLPALAQVIIDTSASASTATSAMPFVCTATAKEVYGSDAVYTQKIVDCVTTAVKQSTYELLNFFSKYMTPIVAAMFTLALVALGLRIIGSDRDIFPNAGGFLLRMGIIGMFCYNLGGWSHYVFEILSQGITLVVGVGYSPWVQIDTFLGKLLGFATGYSVSNGFLGIFAAGLFSKTTGVMMGFAGIMVIFSLLMFIFQIVFIYLSAIVVLGFLLVISPLIIPLAIFRYTERYFKMWVDLMISAMLTPIFMFAILWMFLGIFDKMLLQLFTIVGCDDPTKVCKMQSFWRENQPIWSWVLPTDPNTVQQISNLPADSGHAFAKPQVGGARILNPIVGSNINPLVRHSYSNSLFNVPGINFGPNDNMVKQNLASCLISLWIFTMLMKSLLMRVPEIADSIAGGARSGLSMRPSDLQTGAENFMSKSQNFVTSNIAKLGTQSQPRAPMGPKN